MRTLVSARQLIVLGTACQVPTRQRNHNGYFVKWDDQGFLFDPGEGTQRQMTFTGVTASQITKIFISHFHGDHCLGLPGVVQRISLDEVQHPIHVFFPASGEKFYRRLIQAAIFQSKQKLIPHPIEKSGVIFEDNKFIFKAQFLNHTVDSLGYRIQEKETVNFIPERLEKANIRGGLIGKFKDAGQISIDGKTYFLEDFVTRKKGNSFTYIPDTRFCQQAVDLAADSDVLLCEATYLNDREDMAEKFGHLTAVQAGKLAQLAGVRKLYLTHFSQIYLDASDFVCEAKQEFGPVIALEDLQRFDLPRSRRIAK
jgi:ribonuclease Z